MADGTIRIHISEDGLMEWATKLGLFSDGRLAARLIRAVEEEYADIGPELEASALIRFPHRGGLAATIAGELEVSVDGQHLPEGGAVEIKAVHRYFLPGFDETGIIIHPTFGHPPWVIQHQRGLKGWFSETVGEHRIGFRERLKREVEEFARELGSG